jgi:hypothetical protein
VSSVVPEGAAVELSVPPALTAAELPVALELVGVEPLVALADSVAELSVVDVHAATSRSTIPVAVSLPRVDLFIR